jgi:acetyltransferase-like isoleucine patch superfamily enzyme
MLAKTYRLLRYDWPMHFVLLFTNWLPDNVVIMNFRGYLASFFFGSCGKRLCLGRNITFYNPSQMKVGKNVYIASGCWFSSSGGILIEDNILFGPYVVVVTSNHSLTDGAYSFGKPINIEEVKVCSGSWVGAHSTILPGSIISKSCLIAANSVFKGNSIERGIYAGLPAVLKKVSE